MGLDSAEQDAPPEDAPESETNLLTTKSTNFKMEEWERDGDPLPDKPHYSYSAGFHWMTPPERRKYRKLIAEQHHLAVAAILQERGAWIDKDGEPNSFAVFPHVDIPFKRCVHGVKYGCTRCDMMRDPYKYAGYTTSLVGVPEAPVMPW